MVRVMSRFFGESRGGFSVLSLSYVDVLFQSVFFVVSCRSRELGSFFFPV